MEISARTTHHDLSVAAELFKKACAADPKFVPARAMYAFALWSLATFFGEHDQLQLAVAAAHEALRLDQSCAQAHRVIASVLLEEAQYSQALAEFWQAVEANPQSSGCFWFERATKLDPSRGEFVGCLGEVYAVCGQDELAEHVFKRALEFHSDTPNILVNLGTLRNWQSRPVEARQFCEQVRSQYPDNRWLLCLAAWIEFSDGKTSRAQALYERLRSEGSYQYNWVFFGAVNPASALAYLAKKSGDLERTKTLVNEALEIDRGLLTRNPNNPRVLHDMAATHCVAGDPDSALDSLEQAVITGWVEYRSTRIDPRFATILHHERYQQLLDAMARRGME